MFTERKERAMKKRALVMCIAVLAVLAARTGPAEAADNTDSHLVEITVSEVANLRIHEGTTVMAAIGSPETAGDSPLITYTNANTNYLQYTSIVADGATRKITGAITGASPVPNGLVLRVVPSSATGNKVGAVGSAVPTTVTLGTVAADIVTGIGSGYTGTAATDGVKLTYSVALTPEDLETAGTVTIEVTYTLTDGS
jgi:hypothetical protein